MRIPASEARKFSVRLAAMTLPEELAAVISPMVTLLAELDRQIESTNEQLRAVAQADPLVGRLCTAPGVGPVTAVTFVAILDEVGRFDTAKQVRGYLGLAPSERSSGERQHRGRITRAGNGRLRALLVEAAWSLSALEAGGCRGHPELGEGHRTTPGQVRRGGGALHASWQAFSSRCGGTARSSVRGLWRLNKATPLWREPRGAVTSEL